MKEASIESIMSGVSNIPCSLIFDNTITSDAVVLLCLLNSACKKNSDIARISNETILNIMGCSINSLHKYLKELKSKNLISVEILNSCKNKRIIKVLLRFP